MSGLAPDPASTRAEASIPLAIGVEPDGERAIVDELDRHLRTEATPSGPDPLPFDRRAEPFVQPLGELRRRGGREPGPPPPGRVGVEGELRHDQGLAAHLREGSVGPAVGVAEDPQLDDPPGQCVGHRLVVAMTDTEKHDEAASDRPDGGAVDPDLASLDALEKRPHRSPTG